MSVAEDLIKGIIEQPYEGDVINKPVAQVIETDEDDAETEIEQKAIEQGWKPDYEGPKKKSAKEFLEAGEQIASRAVQDKRRLEAENEALRKGYEKMMQTSAETVKKIKEDTERQIADLQEKKKEARENLDTDALEKIINRENELRQEKQKLEHPEPEIDPSVVIWEQENPEFVDKLEKDSVVKNYTQAVALEMRNELLKLPPSVRFDKIKERVMSELPHKFTNPNQDQAPRTLTMNRTQTPQKSSNDKLTVSTLGNTDPTEKAAYDILVKAKRFKTFDEKKAFDERYIENYKASRNLK